MSSVSPISPRLRLGVLGIVVVSLFAVLFARLWYLQVLAAPSGQQEAELNRVRLVTTPAPRGRILDRNGRVLVDNRVSNVVLVSRALVKDRDAVLGRLSALLNVPVPQLSEKISDPRYSPYKPVPVAEDVTEQVIIYIREHQDLFPGVEAGQVAERVYPYGQLASHLLGYIGEINDNELKAHKGDGYRLGDVIGKAGIERLYEPELRGKAGIEKLEVDARGKVLRTLGAQQPEQGSDVVVTLDLDVQRLAEDSLAQGLAAARTVTDRGSKKPFRAPVGSVVVLNPQDGSVLAMASNPNYDPNTFVNGIRPDVYNDLTKNPDLHNPLFDRAIQGQYAPGSTFKLVTSLAGLKGGLITPRTTVVDTGLFKIPGKCSGRCQFRNAGGSRYGPVSLTKALTVSSDVFFYSLGYQFWAHSHTYDDGIQRTARSLGLGAPTGIPLAGEADGRIPDPEQRKRQFDANPGKFAERGWFPGDNVNLAIGQGDVLVTPLQLANAYATFANGGTTYQPMLGKEVRSGNTVVKKFDKAAKGSVELPAGMRDPILAGLTGAVQNPNGTAHSAFAGFPFDVLSLAGKTGTAQVHGKQDTAVFVGFGPVAAPEYVVSVVLEESGFGGEAAAPVARRIYDGILGNPNPPPVGRSTGVD